jgi:alpha-D-ribose 1-methylphosphonate 5-triphosphate synthase subunit PhnG
MNAQTFSSERARWISLLAKAPAAVLDDAARHYGDLPKYLWLRRPETGLAMVRARAGGTGAQFNLGEMSVTRCTLRLESGQTGIAYVAGRDKRHAEMAALFDALMQSDARQRVRETVLQPIEQALADKLAQAHAQAQATRVEFMTMARGEDA